VSLNPEELMREGGVRGMYYKCILSVVYTFLRVAVIMVLGLEKEGCAC